jgi:hypothetical protein
VFTATDPYVGVDLDKCRDPTTGALEAWAEAIVQALQTYTEISTSGTGVHCILHGNLPGKRRRKGAIEMYATERYFVMTGQCLPDVPPTIEACQAALDALYAQVFDTVQDGVSTQKRPRQTREAQGQVTRTPDAHVPDPASPCHDWSDEELLAKAHQARNGEKFSRLWQGDTSDYVSPSEADIALCALLAFWTGDDPERIDQLFRQSGLYRDKWDREDYAERTIAHALTNMTAFYTPVMRDNAYEAWQQAFRAGTIQEEQERGRSPRDTTLGAAFPMAYFEHLAQEPGRKALCLPAHYGIEEGIQAFVCQHWQEGCVLALKTSEAATQMAEALLLCSGGRLRDHVLVLDGNEDTALVEAYRTQPALLLQRYPILVMTHKTLVQDPPTFFHQMVDGTNSQRTRVRGFILILDCPDFHKVTLTPVEYGLLRVITDGTDDVEQALQCVRAKMDADNIHIRQAVHAFLTRLAKTDPKTAFLTELDVERALYRLGVVMTLWNTQTCYQDHKGDITTYLHAGLLLNPHVWIIDGTADLTLRDSHLWTMVKDPAYRYRLVCPRPPQAIPITMVSRNLKVLTTEEADLHQARRAST